MMWLTDPAPNLQLFAEYRRTLCGFVALLGTFHPSQSEEVYPRTRLRGYYCREKELTSYPSFLMVNSTVTDIVTGGVLPREKEDCVRKKGI